MDNKTSKRDIEHLEERLKYLEGVNRSTMKALDTVAYLSNFQNSINKLHDQGRILSVTRDRLYEIISFKTTAFFLVDETDSDFVPFDCVPDDDLEKIRSEMDVLIDDGTFARALREKKTIFTHSSDNKEEVLLHVLTTESRVRGMFFGILNQKSKNIKEASVVLLSIIMMHSANAIESFELYNTLRAVNQKLKQKVRLLIESERELLDHREHLDKLVGERTKELNEVNDRLKIELWEKELAENELIKSKQELLDANKRLEASIHHAENLAHEATTANKAKTEFLAGMSHELRTPLNAVIGFSEVLLSETFGPLNEKQKKYADNIHTGGRYLFRLLTNILDYAALESGEIHLEPNSVHIKLLLQNIVASLKHTAKLKNISLTARLSENLNGLKIRGDETRLLQALEHIILNGIKFTHNNGRVEVSLEEAGDYVKIEVKDNGIGITKEARNHIFDLFYQLKGGMSDKTPGTGLGLALVHKIILYHGGSIDAKSTGDNKGAVFTIHLPVD